MYVFGVRKFLHSHSALSSIVAMVLVVLITVGVTSVMWFGIYPMLRVDIQNFDSSISVETSEGYTFYDKDASRVTVQVSSSGSKPVDYVQVIIMMSDGTELISVHDAPGVNARKRYTFDVGDYITPDVYPVSVSVAPIFNVDGRNILGRRIADVKLPQRQKADDGFYDSLDPDEDILVPTENYSSDPDNDDKSSSGGGGESCSDGIQNQGEEGVDCGGPCASCVVCSDGDGDGYDNCTDAMGGDDKPVDCDDSEANKRLFFDVYVNGDGDLYGSGDAESMCLLCDYEFYDDYCWGEECSDPDFGMAYCDIPDGYSLLGGDCNDESSYEFVTLNLYNDNDGDHFGAGDVVLTLCVDDAIYELPPLGYEEYSTRDNDCDDDNYFINQRARELCGNEIADDCYGWGGVDGGCGVCEAFGGVTIYYNPDYREMYIHRDVVEEGDSEYYYLIPFVNFVLPDALLDYYVDYVDGDAYILEGGIDGDAAILISEGDSSIYFKDTLEDSDHLAAYVYDYLASEDSSACMLYKRDVA